MVGVVVGGAAGATTPIKLFPVLLLPGVLLLKAVVLLVVLFPALPPVALPPVIHPQSHCRIFVVKHSCVFSQVNRDFVRRAGKVLIQDLRV